MSLRALLLLLSLCVLAACSDDSAGDASGDVTTEIQHTGLLGQYRSIVYVPSTVDRSRPAPLVMVVHGANTTAEQERDVSLFDEVAKREGFIVAYPDHETDSQLGLHPLQSWRFYNPAEMVRGGGDAAALAEMTQQVMRDWNVDPERVYMVGVSAGGWMTSIMGAAYPDLYAAISVVEGGGYGIGLFGLGQELGGTLMRPELNALAAFTAMGANARIVPVIHFQGSIDAAVPPATGTHAVQQWLMTNNLVASGGLSSPLPLMPSETTRHEPAGAYPYEIDVYRDGEGCSVVEQIRVEGLAHFWPGGTSDPAYDGYSDPLAPSGAEFSWAFLKRYRRSETALPCAEAGR